MWDVLKSRDIPSSLRICAGTDGSVTQLLEVLTGKTVNVRTKEQSIIKAAPDVAKLLNIETGDNVNRRIVTLNVEKMVFVLAKSLAPIERMPHGMKDDLMQADIPIGKILRDYRLETRRDILNIEIVHRDFFGDISVISREYNIIYHKKTLMWINECFPVDDRWRI